MSCYRPLIAVNNGKDPETGKFKIKFLSQYQLICDGSNLASLKAKYGKDLLMIPCGHCIGCVKDRSRNWQARIMFESLYHEKSCFLTLTYAKDPPEKPLKSDLRAFIKACRKKYGTGIKFFGCGEKGGNGTERSHYHLILFGVDFSDGAEPVGKRGLYFVYNSSTVSKIWDKGFVTIGCVDPGSAGYVAQYCDKKLLTGEDKGEFVIMSRGLGRKFFEENKHNIFESDYMFINGNRFPIPRYFQYLANKDDFLIMLACEELKERKKERALQHTFGHGARALAFEDQAMREDARTDLFKKLAKENSRNAI